jgi:hypothetical protein
MANPLLLAICFLVGVIWFLSSHYDSSLCARKRSS